MHFQSLGVEARVKIARSKANKLSRFITTLIQTHANNQQLVYSKRPHEMVGVSFAAHSLSDLQRSSFAMELTRLCALWDAPKIDRISLPTIAALINHPEVLEILRRDHAAGWGGADPIKIDNEDELAPEDIDHFREMFKRSTDQFVERTFHRNLRIAISGVSAVAASARLRAIFNYRNHFIAHNLEEGSLGRASLPSNLPKYGYERKLLRTTQRMANALTVVINNSGFAYDWNRSFAERNSQSLFGIIDLRGAE